MTDKIYTPRGTFHMTASKAIHGQDGEYDLIEGMGQWRAASTGLKNGDFTICCYGPGFGTDNIQRTRDEVKRMLDGDKDLVARLVDEAAGPSTSWGLEDISIIIIDAILAAGDFPVTMKFGEEFIECILRWELTTRTDTMMAIESSWIKYSIGEKGRPEDETGAITGGIFTNPDIAKGLKKKDDMCIYAFCGAIACYNQYILRSGGIIEIALNDITKPKIIKHDPNFSGKENFRPLNDDIED